MTCITENKQKIKNSRKKKKGKISIFWNSNDKHRWWRRTESNHHRYTECERSVDDRVEERLAVEAGGLAASSALLRSLRRLTGGGQGRWVDEEESPTVERKRLSLLIRFEDWRKAVGRWRRPTCKRGKVRNGCGSRSVERNLRNSRRLIERKRWREVERDERDERQVERKRGGWERESKWGKKNLTHVFYTFFKWYCCGSVK